MHKKKGFTLIELLVVIVIIALLLSILLPALQTVKIRAQRVICMTSISGQQKSMAAMLSDRNDKFPNHAVSTPERVREWSAVPGTVNDLRRSQVYQVMESYIDDPIIFYCALTRHFGSGKDDYWTNAYSWNGPDYGSWAGKDPVTGLGSRVKSTPYFWLPNYQTFNEGIRPVYKFTSLDGQQVNSTPWPTRGDEMTGMSPVIVHRLSYNNMGGVGWFWDLGHRGGGGTTGNNLTYADVAKTEDQPIGFGDGHVEYRNKKDVKPRAQTTSDGRAGGQLLGAGEIHY